MSPVDHKAAVVGIANTATLNLLNDTLVGMWDLEQDKNDHAPQAESILFTNPGEESVIGEDERQRVPPSDFAPGGKYRSIVKLFCLFKDARGRETWMHGTGWLIRDDLLVTAGHCAFDWAHKLGTCTQVKAYIGYDGKKSTKSANCQFRTVSRVATTSAWLTAKGNRQSDVSFMKLDKPFTGVTPFKFIDTPVAGTLPLGVVGYPADLKSLDGEYGAQMYEMFLSTKWDLSTSEWTMLEYRIDTYGGCSGSPVLRESDFSAMGVHVYGGATNSASVIGIHGNQFLDYVAAFDLKPEKVKIEGGFATSTPGIQYVRIPSSKTPNVNTGVVNLAGGQFKGFSLAGGFNSMGFTSTNGNQNEKHLAHRPINGRSSDSDTFESFLDIPSLQGKITNGLDRSSVHNNAIFRNIGNTNNQLGDDMSEEGFLDFLKTAVGVGAPILSGALQAGLPMAFGPIGGVVGAIAGTALSAAGKLARGGAESGVIDAGTPEEITMRSIYAEAALQSMLKMNKERLEEEGFIDDMKTVAGKLAPVVKRVAPKILGVVKNDVMQMLLEHLSKGKTDAEGAFDFMNNTVRERPAGRRLPPQVTFGSGTGAESFAQHVAAASNNGEEGLFGDIFSTGIKIFAPMAGPAISGLVGLVGSLAESSVMDEQTNPDPGLSGLTERAILAEAALQAAINAPHDFLEEEGFFSSFGSIVSSIGSTVLKHAPGVIKAVTPIVGNLINGALGAESNLVARPAGRTLKSKRSTAALRDQEPNFQRNPAVNGRHWG